MLAERHTNVPDASQQPVHVTIVDDAVVVRGMLARWLGEESGVEIIGTHRNGAEALASDRKPDVIVLDIDMPEMDGITALPKLIKKWPAASIIMASTLTTRNAEITLHCLSMGAHDYITKPATNRDVTFSTDFRREIVAKVRALGHRTIRKATGIAAPANTIVWPRDISRPENTAAASSLLAAAAAARKEEPKADLTCPEYSLRTMPGLSPKVLMIGASTGGPKVILEFLQAARAVVQAMPVVIVQHMPSMFTNSFAESIRKQLAMDSSEAQHGEPLERGRIYVAPGGRHLRIERNGVAHCIGLDDSAPVNFFRPSVDIAFQSAARCYGSGVLAVMLTGMGTDGLAGSTEIIERGGAVIAQDETSSIVWGMPGAVTRNGLCSVVAPVAELAAFAVRLTNRNPR
jgi:two-component system, chemotaxis family, protein-glutamate methylesterase/glutaminase